MTAFGQRFLPDDLRPTGSRRRSRRGWLLPAVAATAVLLVAPTWRVTNVTVRGADAAPAQVADSLHGLQGHLVPLLDLDWLHDVAASWPQVSEVRVSLDLPGTVVVEIFPVLAKGSMAVGAGWHAVAADGRLAGSLELPKRPVLSKFQRPADRRGAFAVARRLAEATDAEVLTVRQVTPMDYRVELRRDGVDGLTTVHVTPNGTEAEKVWCERVKADGFNAVWADLRWRHRFVERGAA